MSGINNSYDRHLDPPDEIEGKDCEECGQKMEYHKPFYKGEEHWWSCPNSFCPSKHVHVGKEMAEKLVETLDTVSRLEARVKFLARKLQIYEMIEKGV
jgi:hypothetical protein